MSSENEQPQKIRANRLSNREVMLSAVVFQNMNMPSTSSASLSGGYKCGNWLPSSVSSGTGERSNDRSEQSSNQASASASIAESLSSSSAAAAAAAVASEAAMINHLSSPLKSDADESETNNDDDLSLSQYELDIMNKYLNDMCDSDESYEQDEIIGENLDEQLAIALSIHIDNGNDGTHAKQTEQLVNATDHYNGIHVESDIQSQSHSQDASSSSSTDQHQHQQQQQANVLSHPSSNANANDDIQCTQASRQSEFDQSNQSNAMINQTMQCNIHESDTHDDVNNNNISSLNSNIGYSHSTVHSIEQQQFGYNGNSNNNHQTSDSRRHCDNNNRNRTNPFSSNSDTNRITSNLPIIVGITSCVWGLFFYAAKSFYSDLT